ncbi:dsDNA nuclease domain-containing protein [Sporomusa sp.]|uniref:dsDNA nuclease domain-containing protein n=1 Tax=Sporomusa sp. TaxID=2078658 RepID=UPI002BF6EB74|nr:dsDNA nuclease domain-containing protein [Sporomusa sp.]HWR45071.1 dsDNA nuclease domain-containing protein [Sporomusa sp.]
MSNQYLTTPILDKNQLARIEAVHKGFLYQHLYAAACLLLAQNSGITSIVVERDEDVEVVFDNKRIYIQVKTRSRPLKYSDIDGAIQRFDLLRIEHQNGVRPNSAKFVVVSNIEPGEALMERISQQAWPGDVQIVWPDSISDSLDDGLPMPWENISDAFAKCAELAATIPYGMLAPETLVGKLAWLVMLAASGNPPREDHSFLINELSQIFEQMVVQLQDFPDPPAVYRAQADEPPLVTEDRIRIITGYSGSGKTSWVSQAATFTTSTITYMDVKDTPGTTLASALARELAARLFGKKGGRLGEVLLPGASGLETLHAIDTRLITTGEGVTVVLDNAHHLPPADLQAVIQQRRSLKFILICQPGRNVFELETSLSIMAEALHGWAIDTIASEVAIQGCRGDFAACQRLLELTAGLPLYVQNAIAITAREYEGSLTRFCSELEAKTHAVETAQEIILARVFDGFPDAIRDAIGILSLSDIPLERNEASEMLAKIFGLEDRVIAALFRQLRSTGSIETFGGNRFKVHDAMRLLGQSHLDTLGKEFVRKAQDVLKGLVFASLRRHLEMSKFSFYLRMLMATGDIKPLIQLATDELFHELGVNPEIMMFLAKAASSKEIGPKDRFWMLDALVFADMKQGNSQIALERLEEMRQLLKEHNLGVDERLALAMKRMNVLAREGRAKQIEAAMSDIFELLPESPVHQRIFRYNTAHALYDLGRYEAAIKETHSLIREYYDLLGITPEDIFGVNPDKIWPLLKKDKDITDTLKHLADCLDLNATAMNFVGRISPFGRLHAMKFYAMAGAPDSLIRVGQEVVDEFIRRNDFIGAREVLEKTLLPNVLQLKMSARIIPVRSQYAVVLAYCDDFDAADAEMARLKPYEAGLDELGKLELRNQRKAIEEMRQNGIPKWRMPGTSKINSIGNSKIGRNAPCPCGSGKKFKKCHGR